MVTKKSTMKIIHYYRRTETPHSLLPSIKEQLYQSGDLDGNVQVVSIETESCFNVQLIDGTLDGILTERLEWLLRETFEPEGLRLESSTFDDVPQGGGTHIVVVEFGPRMTFTSAFSSNATSICVACGLSSITRLERSRRYRIAFSTTSDGAFILDTATIVSKIKGMLHDRMTEEEYLHPIDSFESGAKVVPVERVPIMEEGKMALMRINEERGLGFDEFDINFYTELFKVS